MEAVEGVEVGSIGAFGDPNRVAIRVYGATNCDPFGGSEEPVGPEEDDGFAVYAQVSGVIGVAAKQSTQGVDAVVVVIEEGAACLEVYGRFEAGGTGGVEQGLEVGLGLVVDCLGTIPALHKGIYAC